MVPIMNYTIQYSTSNGCVNAMDFEERRELHRKMMGNPNIDNLANQLTKYSEDVVNTFDEVRSRLVDEIPEGDLDLLEKYLIFAWALGSIIQLGK